MFSPTYSKEGHAVTALFELVGLNPDNKINYLIKENGFK
jgi:hypothetical protein